MAKTAKGAQVSSAPDEGSHAISTAIGGILTVAATVLYFSTDLSQEDSDGVYFLSRIVLVLIFVLGAATTYQSFRKFQLQSDEVKFDPLQAGRFFALLGMCIAYIMCLQPFGFILSSLIFVGVVAWMLGYRNVWALAVFNIAFVAMIWALFSIAFNILLPVGTLIGGKF